jgi:PAS domain S-box-containing protein
MVDTERFDSNSHAYRRMQELATLVPVAMLEVSVAGNILWTNERWGQLTGLHHSPALNQMWFDAVHPDERARVMAAWQQACIDGPELISLKCRLVTLNGEHRYVEMRGTVFPDGEIRETTYLLTTLDVTDNRRVNELARTTRELEVWAEQSSATLAEQSRELGIFKALVACSVDAIAIVEADGKGQYANGAFRDLFELKANFYWDDLLVALGVDEMTFRALRVAVEENGSWQSMVSLNRPQRGPLSAELQGFALTDATSRSIGFALIVRDLSAHKALEEERERLAAEVIAAQEAAIRELSTPLLPIGPGILAMPLIGNISEKRGLLILDTLLEGIQRHSASVAILDVTGVRQMNDNIADILLRSARAAGLLGTTVILTGVSPLVARTIIDLGVDLGPIQTHATLEQGILAAFAQARNNPKKHRPNNHLLASSSR